MANIIDKNVKKRAGKHHYCENVFRKKYSACGGTSGGKNNFEIALKDVRKPDALDKLTKALSFQIGSQVSNRELSQIVGIDKETVDKYIYLLEEAYIIFRLGSYSKNLRNELKFSRKIYFVDTGLRNALINRFSPLSLREDTGSLWENYLISERRKKIEYEKLYRNTFFWRTTRQQEIDYIEELRR